MITTVKLISISYPHKVTTYLCVMRVSKIYCLNEFPSFNTVLFTIVFILYIQSLFIFIFVFVN